MTTKCKFCSEEILNGKYGWWSQRQGCGNRAMCSKNNLGPHEPAEPSTEGTQAAQPEPVAQVDAPMKHYITKPQSEVIKEMVPVWEKAFTEACEALAKCGAEFCKHARREHKDSCGCLHLGCECDTFIPEPAVAQTELPPIPLYESWPENPLSTKYGKMFEDSCGTWVRYSDHKERIASLTQRLQASEAREAELKAELSLWRSEHEPCPFQLRMEALERSHKALLDSVEDILGYTGGADNALEDEYVMERLHANWAVAQKLAAAEKL